MYDNEHFFTTYVRTKTVFNHRFNGLKDYSTVKIYVYELKKLGVNDGPLLYSLKQKGEIAYDKDGNFKAVRKGRIDPSLLERTRKRPKVNVPLTPLHLYMMSQLLHVSTRTPFQQLPVYFKAFLTHRDKLLPAFFTVDAFAGRVHTPVVNLKGDLRSELLFYGEECASLDVKQMQPTILAKVLLQAVGSNAFSDAIFSGVDVYVILQDGAGLSTRDEAKKMLFQLIFGKPMDGIGKMFKGDVKWVDWINAYKKREEPLNPHKEDVHTNLAWLLQYSEVKVMTEIWERLMQVGIPFLTIHDELLCRRRHKKCVSDIMTDVLSVHFSKFEINITG